MGFDGSLRCHGLLKSNAVEKLHQGVFPDILAPSLGGVDKLFQTVQGWLADLHRNRFARDPGFRSVPGEQVGVRAL